MLSPATFASAYRALADLDVSLRLTKRPADRAHGLAQLADSHPPSITCRRAYGRPPSARHSLMS